MRDPWFLYIHVTLSQSPTVSSLKITFRYASSRLCNQLIDSFRQPHQSCHDSLPHTSSHLSHRHLPTAIDCCTPGLPSRIIKLDRTIHAHWFIFSSIFVNFLFWFKCGRLSWLIVSFWLVYVYVCLCVPVLFMCLKLVQLNYQYYVICITYLVCLARF